VKEQSAHYFPHAMHPTVTIALQHSEKPMGCPVITPAGEQALGIQFSHNHPVSWLTRLNNT
jgi:hypothetical protein